MSNGDLLTQARQLAEGAAKKADEFSGVLGSAQGFILEQFGQNGLYAAYILVAALSVFILSKLVKITFATVKYLVIPSMALAFLGSFFVPYSFPTLLPVTVTVCSVFLLFKG
ncbi:MAG: hypothetical protein JSV52_03180 [Candidatus Zixiibacteriota bacterium]|nr:MAG: hypothetical protein JSV52_03180 [candidate division Zixibacteria bacterium]